MFSKYTEVRGRELHSLLPFVFPEKKKKKLFALPTNDRSALQTQSSSRDSLGPSRNGIRKMKTKRKKYVRTIKNAPDLIIPLVADVQTASNFNDWNDWNDWN